MRTARSIALALLLLPSLASAQVYVPIPPPPAVRISGGPWFKWRRWRAPPPVVVAPARRVFLPPPPPVYVSPPPAEVYIQPPAVVVQQPVAPVYSYPTVVARPMAPPKPDWTSRFGLGATYEGVFAVESGGDKGMGFMGQLRYRTTRHLALELMSGYERSTDDNGVLRTDVPVSFGLIVPFLGPEHMFTPYFVVAGGVNFADLHLVDAPGFQLDDKRIQALGQIGGGLELRLGRHFAINGDVRLEGRWNLDGPSPTVQAASVKVDTVPEAPIASSVGLRLGVGGTVYF